MQSIIDTPEDIQWLRDVHLAGVDLPQAYAGFRFAILYGNEDAPGSLDLYASAEPCYFDPFCRVVFEDAGPVCSIQNLQ